METSIPGLEKPPPILPLSLLRHILAGPATGPGQNPAPRCLMSPNLKRVSPGDGPATPPTTEANGVAARAQAATTMLATTRQDKAAHTTSPSRTPPGISTAAEPAWHSPSTARSQVL